MSSLVYCRKIKLEPPHHLTSWNHRGGWGTVLEYFKNELSAPDGTLCVSALEEMIKHRKTISEPWVGFVHHVPCSNLPDYPDLSRVLASEYFLKSLPKCRDLSRVLASEYFLKSLPKCQGLFKVSLHNISHCSRLSSRKNIPCCSKLSSRKIISPCC
jgi:hypothetical protein